MDGHQRGFKAVEASYGNSVLNLVISSGYLVKLIGKTQTCRYLEQHHPELLVEFKVIVAAASLKDVEPRTQERLQAQSE